jgi:hypothetical protein
LALGRGRAAAACGAGAAALALATPLAAGAARPGYGHCAQFISELGERGAPHAALVSLAGFLPIGMLTLAFCALAAGALSGPRARLGLLLLSGVGWAYVVAAFFPCDPGCPSPGSPTQQIHTAFGAVEYLGGAFGLLLLRAPVPARARVLFACALVVLAAFAGMLAPALEPWRGGVQRVAEAALFLSVLAVGAELWKRRA